MSVRECMGEKEQGGVIKPFKYYAKQTIKTDNKKTVVIHEKKVKIMKKKLNMITRNKTATPPVYIQHLTVL